MIRFNKCEELADVIFRVKGYGMKYSDIYPVSFSLLFSLSLSFVLSFSNQLNILYFLFNFSL